LPECLYYVIVWWDWILWGRAGFEGDEAGEGLAGEEVEGGAAAGGDEGEVEAGVGF
jgi:hypothetical protein